MREAARNKSLLASGALDGRGDITAHPLIQRRELVPSDCRLKGVHDHAAAHRRVAPVRHAQKGIAPGTGGTAAVFRTALPAHGACHGLRIKFTTMVTHQLQRAAHRLTQGVIGRLEAQHHDRRTAIADAREHCLERVE